MSSDALPPWEEIQWFLSPLVTTMSVSPMATGWVQLVPGNPNRVSLWISTSQPATVTPDNTIGTGYGLNLSPSLPPLVFREKDDANMCTSAWYVYAGTTAAVVTAIEVILRTWPQGGSR